jgi:hypothetical protein
MAPQANTEKVYSTIKPRPKSVFTIPPQPLLGGLRR